MKKFFSLLVVAILSALGVVMISPISTQAHTGDLESTAVCQDDGTYLVTYTLTLSNVPSGNTGTVWWRIGDNSFDGTPTNNSGMSQWGTKEGNGTVTLGTKTLPGTSTQAPWAYAWTKWTPDNFSKGSDGGDIRLAGTCVPKTVKDAAFTQSVSDPTCDSAAILTFSGTAVTFSQSSPVTGPGAKSVTATPIAGHEWVGGGKETRTVYSGTLAGALDPDNDQCASKTATADVEVTPPTCDAAGSAEVAGLSHATLEGTLDQTPGAHEATFKADSGFRFADGSKTKIVSYTIEGVLDPDTQQCQHELTPVAPTYTDPCGEGNISWDTPFPVVEHASWSLDGTTAVLTADKGFNFGEAGKVVRYELPADSGVPCPVDEPQPPVVVDGTCDDPDGSLTLPESTETIVYTLNGDVLTATPQGEVELTIPEGSLYTLNEDGSAWMTVTQPIVNNDPSCSKPDGYKQVESESQCVKGDLVTTSTETVGTPVEAEDGTWSIQVTSTSSQTLEEDAKRCASHDNSTPTEVEAGLAGQSDTDVGLIWAISVLVVFLVAGLTSALVVIKHGKREQ